MALVSLQNLLLSYGEPPLLDRVNLQIEKGERVGLIGRNGEGKTTLLRLISGHITPDDGEILLQKGIRVACLTQALPAGLTGTVREVVSGGCNGSNHRADAVLTHLTLNGTDRFESLSVGFKRRALLATALAAEPDVLLLDEPTNHLDIATIAWLEDYLLTYRGTLILITHDRAFLRKIATRIVELDRGRISSWACDYRTYIERREAALLAEEAQRKRFLDKLAQEEIWIRQGVKARCTRNEGRVRALLKMREEQKSLRSRLGGVRMHIEEARRTGKLVIEAQAVSHTNEARRLIDDFSLRIMRGDRIGIIGPNGVGKTTLLRILLGEIQPYHGQVRHGTNLQPVYFDQVRAQLEEDRTVEENIAGGEQFLDIDGRRRHVISYLKDFLFSPERSRGPVRVLSGGERNRLLLARLFCRPSNLLVLDEPTNDLDMETLELLEDRLLEYSGTILLVSHDREFLNNVVTGTLVFDTHGKIGEYAGGYDDWLIQRTSVSEETALVRAKTSDAPRKLQEKRERHRKLTFKENRELAGLPAQIESLEAEQRDLVARMANPQFYKHGGEEIGKSKARLVELEGELEVKYARWQALESIREGT
jgi:ATP-binding cassette subfamily F protein uup